MISDDDDFEAEMQAAQQQMQQKVASNGLNGDIQNERNDFEENSRQNTAALAHQQYNTDNILAGGLSEKKSKKGKKKQKSKNIVNKTALVDPAGMLDNQDYMHNQEDLDQGNYS